MPNPSPPQRTSGDGSEEVVALRGIGVVIGEQSLLTGAPRAASARASTSVLALRLPHSAMKQAMEQYPELSQFMWLHVALNLAQKLLGEVRGRRTLNRSACAAAARPPALCAAVARLAATQPAPPAFAIFAPPTTRRRKQRTARAPPQRSY